MNALRFYTALFVLAAGPLTAGAIILHHLQPEIMVARAIEREIAR